MIWAPGFLRLLSHEHCPSVGGTAPFSPCWTVSECQDCLGWTFSLQWLRYAFKSFEMSNFLLSHLNSRILAVLAGFRFDLCPFSAQPGLLDLAPEFSSFTFAHYVWLGQLLQLGFSIVFSYSSILTHPLYLHSYTWVLLRRVELSARSHWPCQLLSQSFLTFLLLVSCNYEQILRQW